MFKNYRIRWLVKLPIDSFLIEFVDSFFVLNKFLIVADNSFMKKTLKEIE
jgi:hypothetical protein